MSFRTLEGKIQTIGNPVERLRNASAGPYQLPIKAEFTNWRDEQKAWCSGAVLFDQSFHQLYQLMVKDKFPLMAFNGCQAVTEDGVSDTNYVRHKNDLSANFETHSSSSGSTAKHTFT